MVSAQHFVFADLPRESLFDGTYERSAIRGDRSMVTFNWMHPAMPAQPNHSHDFDQLALIVEGAMDFEVEGETYRVGAGEGLLIPANAQHTGVAVGDGVALNLDVYAPPRLDYLHLVEYQQHGSGTTRLSPTDVAAVDLLLAEWTFRLDHGAAETLGELITPEGIVTGLGPEIHGRNEIRRWAASRPHRTTHHMVTNSRYYANRTGGIEGTADLTLYISNGVSGLSRVFTGRYNDVISRTPHGLKFIRRDIKEDVIPSIS
ncbi:cupin domain-containing protein [Rhodococcus sp. USK13]|uniref:cupin domain-containing protein n=1 Tax=Rhodococcus sp. USK13 TaxID=2806442 RepID=UPI001BCE7E60|nr:cupin domain-containing protein [Rhodococcus sp. USK13]